MKIFLFNLFYRFYPKIKFKWYNIGGDTYKKYRKYNINMLWFICRPYDPKWSCGINGISIDFGDILVPRICVSHQDKKTIYFPTQYSYFMFATIYKVSGHYELDI